MGVYDRAITEAAERKKSLIQIPVCRRKITQEKSIKIEYCFPLGSDYPNRQSATFFIFRNYQHSTERTRYQK